MPTALLEPHRNKGAFKQGNARLSITTKPAEAKDEKQCVGRSCLHATHPLVPLWLLSEHPERSSPP